MPTLDAAIAGPYNIFFLLALATGGTIAWRAGREHAPAAAWAAVLALAVGAGMVGARVLHFDGAAGDGAKTVLGGVVAGTLALLAGIRLLRLDPRTADALATALPLGFAVGRIGCLLAGCCFGEHTDLPWGAIYDRYSAAWAAQLRAGLITPDAATASPVHPTQIYEALLALGVASAVPRLRCRLRAPGSSLLAALVLLGAGRAALEALRPRELATFAGLTQVQWLVAALTLTGALLLVVRERRPDAGRTHFARASAPLRATVAAAAVPVVLIVAGASWFSPLELLSLQLAAAAALVALVLQPATRWAVARTRLATPVLVSAAVLAIALQQTPRSGEDGAWPRSFLTIGLSGSNSVEEDFLTRTVGVGDCGSPLYHHEAVRANYGVAGATVGFRDEQAADRATTIRLRGFAGRERVESLETRTRVSSQAVGGLGASISHDRSWVGVTGGLAGGTFAAECGDCAFRGFNESGTAMTVALRLGQLTSVHAFAGLNDVDPIGRTEHVRRAGFGLGSRTGSAIRAGVWREMPFVSGTLVLGEYQIESSAAFGQERDMRIGVTRAFRIGGGH